MKAVLYQKPMDYIVTDVETPTIKENQVLIKVKSCGVCRTDIHIHHGEFIAEFPLTPGHEFVGEIVALGEKVNHVKIGDRVAADNTVLCGHCYYCKRNQPLYCENFYSLGVTGPGGFAEYVVVNHDKVFFIDDLSYDQAVFAEPLACAVHGMDKIDVQPGDDILMFGTGPTGLLLAQLLVHGGASNVVVVASDKRKLDVAKNLGVHETIQMDRSDYSIHEQELKQKSPRGFDIIIDATGAEEVIQHLPQFSKKGSKIVIYGVASQSDKLVLSPYEIFEKELNIIGSFAQTHCFDRAIKYLQNGVVKVDELITHRFNLDDFHRGLDQVENGKGHIKVVIDV
ncbi:zinc-dependent alcohol dehydrogenase family protein [Gracilibacillus sp. YIM 98692]|uniref:zinc-dependent alcohol dehydrogenase family protein n=1 Tax=Gracilibacillus sp. YIM 98692 TaxID=2663532 RepID=UPI0013D553F3|nr:zinc-dependent alcohol dehydrogenase family protein [Gracilibacillus sp. YIM 98692]